jgi:hypothetical protein
VTRVALGGKVSLPAAYSRLSQRSQIWPTGRRGLWSPCLRKPPMQSTLASGCRSPNSSISSLGAAGAAVVFVVYFLWSLKEKRHEQWEVFKQFRGCQSESKQKGQERLNR